MFAKSGLFGSRWARLVFAVTVVAGVAAVVAATPSVSIGKEEDVPPALSAMLENAIQPLGRGPTLRVARAFDQANEDCSVVFTRVADASGRVRVKRALSCAN
ncbi:MAG TPA: hypothetical protein VEH76_09775 [Methylocystis sp.]|nr:hypothetical protein [Methylocystis sp.]